MHRRHYPHTTVSSLPFSHITLIALFPSQTSIFVLDSISFIVDSAHNSSRRLPSGKSYLPAAEQVGLGLGQPVSHDTEKDTPSPKSQPGEGEPRIFASAKRIFSGGQSCADPSGRRDEASQSADRAKAIWLNPACYGTKFPSRAYCEISGRWPLGMGFLRGSAAAKLAAAS